MLIFPSTFKLIFFLGFSPTFSFLEVKVCLFCFWVWSCARSGPVQGECSAHSPSDVGSNFPTPHLICIVIVSSEGRSSAWFHSCWINITLISKFNVPLPQIYTDCWIVFDRWPRTFFALKTPKLSQTQELFGLEGTLKIMSQPSHLKYRAGMCLDIPVRASAEGD